MKDDEKALLKALANSPERLPKVRDIGEVLQIHPKRIYSIVCKWSRKGFYEWGVSHDLGWLTNEGKAWAIELGIKR